MAVWIPSEVRIAWLGQCLLSYFYDWDENFYFTNSAGYQTSTIVAEGEFMELEHKVYLNQIPYS